MLDEIRKEIALATVEPTGGVRSITGKQGNPSNESAQALVVQVAAHLSVRMLDLFGGGVDAMPLDVEGTPDQVYAVVNPRSAAYDDIGAAFTKLRVITYSRAKADEGGASIEICKCHGPDAARTLLPILSALGAVHKAGAAMRVVVAPGNTLSLRMKTTGHETPSKRLSLLEKLNDLGGHLKELAAGIKVYEAQPVYAIKSGLR